MVCGGGDGPRLTALAEAVAERFREPFAGPGGDLTIEVSVGLASGRPGEAPDALMARADQAMYGAKSRHTRHEPRLPADG
jgi:PleD family two-component response regulator